MKTNESALAEEDVAGWREPPKEDNKLRTEDKAVHDWYRFVLSFPPHLVRQYISRFNLGAESVVLDPFCGTGTTLVECKKRGIATIGIEANPIACFASAVKVSWDVSPDALLSHARAVADITLGKLNADGVDGLDALPLFQRQRTKEPELRTLPADALKLLLKNSISPLPLHKTLALLEALSENIDPRFDDHERLALAKTVVFAASNLHFGPEVGVGRAKSDAPVVESWIQSTASMARDLQALGNESAVPAVVHCADARSLASVLEPNSVDAIITSPPYPNEKDYTRTTRLESVLLGFFRSREQLRSLKQGLLRSNTRNVYKDDNDDLTVAHHQKIQRIANAIEARRIELGKTSGWERLYSKVTKLYFGGMAQHLTELRKVLRPGAQLAYVVGDQASYLRVMIRTGQLLAEIAESLGYEVTSIDLFRTRLATATKQQLREEVVCLRWPGNSTGTRS